MAKRRTNDDMPVAKKWAFFLSGFLILFGIIMLMLDIGNANNTYFTFKSIFFGLTIIGTVGIVLVTLSVIIIVFALHTKYSVEIHDKKIMDERGKIIEHTKSYQRDGGSYEPPLRPPYGRF